ncbi:hypothetical protein D0809_05930 [Flavobacterium circumlabens]|uniref:Uncharacterized protein n=1 Tax=Flavobacterium circumlabens TaxID=2133765 RepID=A0A4Y7UE64_9FLAO|nr:hypothetical protein [Flavobacterium circumlabens]TCN59433.1 hypothetical protein EV142_10249 [Flavobacterium circumlabens]TEB44737.1 hypothetical protein D0809_05930 [Flavobacterium circumlabens]
MKENFKRAVSVITVLLISVFFTRCQQEDEVVVTQGTTLSSAKQWFKEYEAKGDNYVYLQNLIYEWPGAIVKQAEDGTEVIVIPIKELKIDDSEIWQQRLYLYKLPDGSYKASLVEIYPDKAAPQEDQSMEGGNFNGYISVWDLKKGFVKAAQFKDNHAVEDGIVEVLPREDKTTYRAPSLNPCGDGCNDGPGGGNPTPVPRILPTELREVVKINSYTGPKPKLGTPVAYYGPRSPVIGGTTPSGYTSPRGGNGGGGTAPPPATAANPCDKIKTQMVNANFLAKQEELRKKTDLKNETGYSQSKNGPYTPLDNLSNDSMSLPKDPNTIGYMHTHIDDYDSGTVDPNGDPTINSPIKMFSPSDVKSFIALLDNAHRNNIALDNVYGTMISSEGDYTLRFEGVYSDLNMGLNFDANMNKKYKEVMEDYKSSREVGFLKFVKEQIGINGISLFKINKNGTSAKKTLNNNDKIATKPCS